MQASAAASASAAVSLLQAASTASSRPRECSPARPCDARKDILENRRFAMAFSEETRRKKCDLQMALAARHVHSCASSKQSPKREGQFKEFEADIGAFCTCLCLC